MSRKAADTVRAKSSENNMHMPLGGAAAIILSALLIIVCAAVLCACTDAGNTEPEASVVDQTETIGLVDALADSVWYGFAGEQIEPVITISADGLVTSERLAGFFFGEGAEGVTMRLYENEDGSGGMIVSQGDVLYDIPVGTNITDTRISNFYVNEIQLLFYFFDEQINPLFYCEQYFRIDTGVNRSLSDSVPGTWSDGASTFVFDDDVDESGFGSMSWDGTIGLWATVGDNLIIVLADNETDMPQIFAAVADDGLLRLSRWVPSGDEIIWLEVAYNKAA